MRLIRFYFTLTVCCFLFVCLASSLYGQSPKDSVQTVLLDEVKLISSQFNISKNAYPVSTSAKEINPFEEEGPQLSLQNTLLKVGGVFSANATNFAQDLRISIRGFGARAAFGIRGIKIMVDGVPETTPDGQGQLDNLPLGLLKRIEVVKGPNATAYGNAAGGVIHLKTLDRVSEDFTHLNFVQGQYGSSNQQFTLGKRWDKTEMVVHAQHQKWKGYRDHAGFENNLFNVSLIHKLTQKQEFKFRFNATLSPYAYDAGGQNLTEFENTPNSARDRNLDYNTHEEVNHIKASVAYTGEWENLKWLHYGYLATRDFEALLPFENGGWVNLDRNYAGLGGHIQANHSLGNWEFKSLLGYALDRQEDHRSRYQNLQGERGETRLKQLEKFTSGSIYLRTYAMVSNWRLHFGIRYDQNELLLSDRFLINGNQSDQKQLPALSPQLGLRYMISENQSVFLQISKSFETPTLSELSADPQGNGGFNPNLNIQKATNLELGWEQRWKKNRYAFTLFSVHTADDLVPYELDAFPGRTFYNNAGSTRRLGIELESEWTLTSHWSLVFNYNYADYLYLDFLNEGERLDGNRLPGIPKHQGYLSTNYTWGENWNLEASLYYRGELFAENANTVTIESAEVANLSLSKKLDWLGMQVKPTLGIQNALNDKYSDNIRINAFGGRYYEAAPLRNVYAGVRFTF